MTKKEYKVMIRCLEQARDDVESRLNGWRSQFLKLADAVRKHRDQKADDRCWMDDCELYKALGDGVEPDNAVGDKFAMLKNCTRFIDTRCAGGNWPTYAELEQKAAAVDTIFRTLDDYELYLGSCAGLSVDSRKKAVVEIRERLRKAGIEQ